MRQDTGVDGDAQRIRAVLEDAQIDDGMFGGQLAPDEGHQRDDRGDEHRGDVRGRAAHVQVGQQVEVE